MTGFVQSIYYGITIRAGDPKPQPGSARYAEHRRRIHILVVSLYLLYTIYEADFELRRAGTYYSDLSLPFNATEREIKSRFRRLAALYHPDKASSSDTNQADVNAYFVHLKTAADTLTDPARRFAYERFGPEIVTWQHCTTIHDYLMRGAQVLIPYYGIAAAAMYGLGLLGYLDWGRYERWLVLLDNVPVRDTHSDAAVPTRAVRKDHQPVGRPGRGAASVPALPSHFAGAEAVRYAYIAFSQIGPMLSADTSGGQVLVGRKGASQEELLREGLQRLEGAAATLDMDISRLLEIEMAPYAGDEEMLGKMRGKVKEWLVQNTIRADPMVRDALSGGRSRRKGRMRRRVREARGRTRAIQNDSRLV